MTTDIRRYQEAKLLTPAEIIDQVAELHQPDWTPIYGDPANPYHVPRCLECGTDYPCLTAKLVDA